MRLAHPFSRALISLCFTLALCALFVLPQADAPAQARPLQQQVPVEPTQANNPGQPLDLVLRDQRAKFGNQGQVVTFAFEVFNNALCNGTVTLQVAATTVQPSPQTTTLTVPQGQSRAITISFFIPSTATVGQTLPSTITVTCPTTATPSTNITDSEIVTITVTINGATPTPVSTATPVGTTTASPSPGPVCLDSFEPDGTPTQAKEILPDLPQSRAICPKGDEDFMYFGGISGKVYTIDVGTMTAGLDLSLSLYDAAGNLLAFNNDFPRNNDAFDIKPRIQSWRAPANGQYFVKVRDDAGRGDRGLTYTVELQSESYGPTPTLVAELCSDLFEPDGVPEQARLLVIREVQPNHKFCPAGDADWVRFFAKAGERFVLRVDSRSRAGADPVMVLVDRDGATILDFSDDTAGSLDPRIEFEVAVDGFYFAQLKNVGDIGNQFIAYDLAFEPLGAPAAPSQPGGTVPTAVRGTPTTTGTAVTGTATTRTPTTTGTAGTRTPTATIAQFLDENGSPYPGPTQTVLAQTAVAQTQTAQPAGSFGGVKGAPAFVNGQAKNFVDPAIKNVWERTDQVIASRQVDRSWMWGPSGLVARAETYTQSNGGARQVQYFDKARMEITDWNRDRSNPWFVTNGLLVKELVSGQLQLGDVEFLRRTPAEVGIAGDADDTSGPTYASFAKHTGPVENRVGQIARSTLRRDGSTGTTSENAAAKLVVHVPETGHNIPQVFWDFLNARGPVGDGKQSDQLVDWVFAMGYPISEPYWTKVKVGGVEKDVLVQAFQRRVLTYTPNNPAGWQVEMGNVGRHYYTWRYGRQP